MGVVKEDERLVMDYGKTVCIVYVEVVMAWVKAKSHAPHMISSLGSATKGALWKVAKSMGVRKRSARRSEAYTARHIRAGQSNVLL
jgi:hypothetical protein